jgi:hypothetical protein
MPDGILSLVKNDALLLPFAAPLSLVFVSTLSTIGYEEYIPYQRSYVNASFLPSRYAKLYP